MIDVDLDLGRVPNRHRAALDEDLHHLAPDLLRLHLPRDRFRNPPGTMRECQTYVLARYGAGRLLLHTPRSPNAPQRPVLRFGVIDDPRRADVVDLPRPFWHARHVDELRRWCGDAERTAFFHPDGTALTEAELPTGPGEPGSAAAIEWATRMWDEHRIEDAFAAVGIEPVALDPASTARLAEANIAPHRLPEVLREAGGGDPFTAVLGWTVLVAIDRAGRTRISRDNHWQFVHLPPAAVRRLPDWDLLRRSRIDRTAVHPLVHRALFPTAPALPPPTDPPAEPPGVVRVRCEGAWHEVRITPRGLSVPHPPQQMERERVLAALGGTVRGCAATVLAWRTGTGRLPRVLRERRYHLATVALHGDTPGVLALLDAGHDPAVRFGGGATLLHYLAHLDHAALLPRLLAAGIDVNAADHQGVTPLHQAYRYGSADLVAALLAAGADPGRRDHVGRAPAELADR
jgi:hypothetical protein